MGTYRDHAIKPKIIKPGTAGEQYLEGETGEAHAFTLVSRDNQLYLVDPALKVNDSSGRHHVVRKVSEKELLTRDIVIPIQNGKNRHYVFKTGTLQFQPL